MAHFGPERAGVLSVLADAQPGRLPERRAELLAAAAELEAETSDTVDRWQARVLARAADVATVESRERLGRIRDGHMADGVDEAVAASGGAGVAVWAHNGHVGVRGSAPGCGSGTGPRTTRSASSSGRAPSGPGGCGRARGGRVRTGRPGWR